MLALLGAHHILHVSRIRVNYLRSGVREEVYPSEEEAAGGCSKVQRKGASLLLLFTKYHTAIHVCSIWGKVVGLASCGMQKTQMRKLLGRPRHG